MFLSILVSSLVIAVSMPLLLYFWYWNLRKYNYVEKIPGPPLLPLFGNLFEFGSSIADFFENLTRLTKEYGSIVRIWHGPFRLTVVISEPKYVEYFLTSKVHLTKSSAYNMYQPWLGMGIINSSGDHWKRNRKMLTPPYHSKILEVFSETFNSAANILIDKLAREVNKPSTDIYPFVNLYALDFICETTMGIKFNAQLNENKEFVRAVVDFKELYMTKVFSVLKRYHFYYMFTKDYRKEQKCVKILKNFTKTVIEDRKRERLAKVNMQDDTNEFDIQKKRDLLDVIMNFETLSDKELNDEMNTIMFGGYGSIASAIGFCLFQAANYPEMQSLLFEEIVSVAGKENDAPITIQHTQTMIYLDRFVKEVFRLYAPVPFFERVIHEDVQLDSFKLPKGTVIAIAPFILHKSEKYFPDPEKFDPDRFLPENVANRHPYAFIPFSAGPRNSIAQRFAMYQVKTTFASIIRSFELLPAIPEHKLLLGNDTVLKSMNGVRISLKIRE